jgi:cytidylate kinase
MMLATAIRARLPLIAVHTNDPLNVGKVLDYYSDRQVLTNPMLKAGVPVLPPDSVTYVLGDFPAIDTHKTFAHAVERNSCLIMVNPEEVHPAMFDAGTVVMPTSMIRDFVHEYAPEDADHYSLEAALRGSSFKEMVELAKLAMAESNEFTADAVLRVRRERTVLSSGLKLVDTAQHYYDPPPELIDWLHVDGRLFTANVARIVRPRGLLFDGLPGTGKTSGAKFIAHSLRLPLYVLDVGGTMQKYVGESERNFQTALRQVEELAPCVMLIDEIEKVFDTDDDSGVSRRVLGSLLWWLQEHAAQVLVVMTTNAATAIPAELVRAGRIDRTMIFRRLTLPQALPFAEALRNSLTNVCDVDQTLVEQAVRGIFDTRGEQSQAEVTQTVIECVKRKLAEGLKE